MKFLVEVPGGDIPRLRYAIAGLMDETPDQVDDVDLVKELFYIDTGSCRTDLDLRSVVKVEVVP